VDAPIKTVLAVYPAAHVEANAGRTRFRVLRAAGGEPVGCWCKDPVAAWRSAAARLLEARPGPGKHRRKGS
jgi:hypothetical protein